MEKKGQLSSTTTTTTTSSSSSSSSSSGSSILNNDNFKLIEESEKILNQIEQSFKSASSSRSDQKEMIERLFANYKSVSVQNKVDNKRDEILATELASLEQKNAVYANELAELKDNYQKTTSKYQRLEDLSSLLTKRIKDMEHKLTEDIKNEKSSRLQMSYNFSNQIKEISTKLDSLSTRREEIIRENSRLKEILKNCLEEYEKEQRTDKERADTINQAAVQYATYLIALKEAESRNDPTLPTPPELPEALTISTILPLLANMQISQPSEVKEEAASDAPSAEATPGAIAEETDNSKKEANVEITSDGDYVVVSASDATASESEATAKHLKSEGQEQLEAEPAKPAEQTESTATSKPDNRLLPFLPVNIGQNAVEDLTTAISLDPELIILEREMVNEVKSLNINDSLTKIQALKAEETTLKSRVTEFMDIFDNFQSRLTESNNSFRQKQLKVDEITKDIKATEKKNIELSMRVNECNQSTKKMVDILDSLLKDKEKAIKTVEKQKELIEKFSKDIEDAINPPAAPAAVVAPAGSAAQESEENNKTETKA